MRRSSRCSIRVYKPKAKTVPSEPRASICTIPTQRFARGRSSASICSSEYQYKDGKWQGQLYDPESGKTYKSQITLRFRRQTADARLHRRADVRPHGGLRAGVDLHRRNIPKMLADGETREAADVLTG